MTIQFNSHFQTVVKCIQSFGSFSSRECLSGRALFTFVYHCASSRVHSDVLSEEGAVELKLVIPIRLRIFFLKTPWFDCHDLNDRGRMEIDQLFASGAVVERATTHIWGRPAACCARSDGDPTRALWRVQPRLLTQKRGQFLHHCVSYQFQ